MMLRLWQRERGYSDTDAGAHFGVTRQTWLRWKGGAVPGPAHMIELFRDGVAQPNDFYDLPELVAPRKAA
ncbi:hypothetical protein HZY97_16125 [Sphingomonas sp. R-74633]|uniref:hypothetical protein n=1 Tax=Sphingomonas sp. R-74633 TaxID=2751188 RepID=UPI0015D173B4|nr:hypothetical protein [Sphingomonas sp. R-74633]NYT42300.1 hypothetical protein [Sphingomonas sp. R-74633]